MRFHVEQEGDHPGRPVMPERAKEVEMEGEKFSEGPWTVRERPGIGVSGVEVSVVVDRHGSPVANCGSGELGAVNAHLVSFAPVMLECLRQLQQGGLTAQQERELSVEIDCLLRDLLPYQP